MSEKCACGHTRVAHKSGGMGECSVGICNCRAFTAPDEPQTLVVEQAVCGAPNGFGPYSHVTCSYPAGHGRLSISVVDDPDPQEADHGNPDAAIWWDEELSPEVCNHAAGFTNADGPLVCSTCGSTCGTPYSSTRAGLLLEQVEDLVDQPGSSYADADTPPPFIPLVLPYIPAPEQAPTIPTDLKGYIVVHAGEIKAGDTVQVIQVEGGALRLAPVQPVEPPTALQKRIHAAIDKGWQGYEDFDPDLAVPAVQELLADLLDELADYHGNKPVAAKLSDLANEVRANGGWIQ